MESVNTSGPDSASSADSIAPPPSAAALKSGTPVEGPETPDGDAGRSAGPLSYTLVYVAAFVVVMALMAAGIWVLRHPGPGAGTGPLMIGAAMLGGGCWGLIGLLIMLPIASQLNALDLAARRGQAELAEMLEKIERRSALADALLDRISQQQMMSDRAKSVAFREKDRDAIRKAVREEMDKQDWEAALALVGDLEIVFGHRHEAEELRREIGDHRGQTHKAQVYESLGPIDRHIQAEAWGTAIQEAQHLMEQFPEDAEVHRLPVEIESRRQMRKQQLKESWQDAVDRHDIDGSIEILRKLDIYLTPAEAEAMQEIARNVFREKRELLRTQFSLAVQEHRWAEAIRIGDEIIREFPNTRIAQEVREKMETLRQRASEPEGTAV